MKINKVNIRKGTVTIDDVKYDIEHYAYEYCIKVFCYEDFCREHAEQLISAGFTGDFTDPVIIFKFVRSCPELWKIADADYCFIEYTDYDYFSTLWNDGDGMLYNDEQIFLADSEFHKNMLHQFYLTDGQYFELDATKEDLKRMDQLEQKYRRF